MDRIVQGITGMLSERAQAVRPVWLPATDRNLRGWEMPVCERAYTRHFLYDAGMAEVSEGKEGAWTRSKSAC